jgi:hypothetical protein
MQESPVPFLGFLLAVNQVAVLKGQARMFKGSLRASTTTG